MKKIYSLFFILGFIVNCQVIFGQTAPSPYNLSSGSWTLTGWATNVAAASYPANGATGANNTTGVIAGAANANMVFWMNGSTDQGLTTAESGNYAGTYTAGNGKLVGNATNGFYFDNTGGVGLGSAVLALNTTQRISIQVAWTARTITTGGRQYGIRLQYRVGASGSFTDANGTVANILYTGGAAGSSQAMTTVTLPAAAENQPVVQLLWRFYYIGPATGTRPQFGVDDITVSSSALPAPVVTGSAQTGNVGTIFSYNISATNSPSSYAITTGSLPPGLNLNTTTGAITGTPTTVGSYSIDVTATNATGTSSPATIGFTISKGNQSISFGALAAQTYGNSSFSLGATAGSGLAVTYISSNPAVATVSGNTVTILTAGTTTITASQAGDANWNAATNVGQTLTVNPKALTISGLTANNRAYNATSSATLNGIGSETLNGVIAADIGNVTLGGTAAAVFANANVGTGKAVTVSGYTISGSASGNYSLTQPAGLTADITAITLSITGPAASNKVYDRTTAATITGTLSGVLPADAGNVTLSSGTSTFVNFNVGTAKAVTAACTLTGSASGNYVLTQPSGLTADITPLNLTISSPAVTGKVYDALTAATITGTLSGIIAADAGTVTLVGTGNFTNANAGAGKAVTASCSLSGAASGNYSLSQPAGLTGTITAKSLTISGATASNKVYDATAACSIGGAPVLVGVIASDAGNVTLGGSASGTFANANVGTGKAVTVSGYTISGSASGNYSLTQPTGLTANITAVTLTVSGATASNKLYDGTTVATVSGGTLSGVIAADIGSVSVSATGTFAQANVGTGIAVTVALTGSAAVNYILTQPGITATIAQAGQTITFGALASKTTADVPFALTATASSGLTVTYISTNTSVATVSGSTVTIVGAGTTTITASQAGNANYTAATDVSQSLVVTVAPVTLGTYPFTSTTCAVPVYGATGVVSNLTFSNVSLTGISCNNNAPSALSSTTSWGTAINTGKYIEFTLTPASNYVLTASTLVFDVWRSGAGATNYAVRSSIDGYTADIATGTNPTSQTSISTITLGASFQNQSSPLTFRIYAWGGNSTGDWRIDNISLTGIVSTGCTPPSTQASAISVSPLGSTTATVGWTNGNGTGGRIVVAYPGAVAGTAPSSGTTYTANAAYGSGSLIGTGRVLYNGSGGTTGSVSVTNLTANTQYTFVVYEYNTASTCYNAATTASITVTTACAGGSPVYASLPVTESFESWINGCSATDRPGSSWLNSPSTGNNSWRRNDQGVSSASWNSNNGAYSPTFSAGAYSARFNSYNATSGTSGTLDLYVDCSSSAVAKQLTFDYINTNGTDILQVFVSTDGGASFPTQLGSNLGVAASWSGQSLSVTSNSATTVIRFKATSDWGTTDIGIDNVKLIPPCVTPDAFEFVSQPANVQQGTNMSAVTVRAYCSATGVTATGYTGSVTLSVVSPGCGYTSQSVNAVAGIATFSAATSNAIVFARSTQTGIQLKATAATIAGTVNSTSFNVTAPLGTPGTTVIASENFAAASTWNYTVGSITYIGSGGNTSGNYVGIKTFSGNKALVKSYSANNSADETESISTITFDNKLTSGYDEVVFKFSIASMGAEDSYSNHSGEGADIGDSIRFMISLDGGTTWSNLLRYSGFNNHTFPFSTASTALAYNANMIYNNSDTKSTFTVTLPTNSTQFMFRAIATNNRINENWAIDDISLTGTIYTLSTPYPLPTATGNTYFTCAGSSTTVSVVTGNTSGAVTYAWTPASNISSTSASNPTVNPPGPATYNVTITDADGCTASTSVSITNPTGTTGVWTGADNNDWFLCTNWGGGAIPSSGTNVTIPSSATYYPIIDPSSPNATAYAGIAYANNITVDKMLAFGPGALLNVAGNITIQNTGAVDMTLGGEINLKGNWANNVVSGGFTAGIGKLNLTGLVGTTQTINTAGTSETFYDVAVNHAGNGVSILKNVSVTNSLTISSGLLDAQSNTLNGAASLTMTGGSLQMAKNGVVLPELTGTYNLTGGTVIFNGSGAGTSQTIRPVNYYNLTSISGTGTRILSSGVTGIAAVLTPGTNMYTVTGSSVNFNGTGAQNIPGLKAGSAPYLNQYNILAVSNGNTKSVTDDFTILDSLKVSTGTEFHLNADKVVTIKSDAGKTARVGIVNGTITYASNSKFLAERYIPPHRAWRLLTAPVAGQTILQGWQEGISEAANSTTGPVGYGTKITGTAATVTGNGFDAKVKDPSLYICADRGAPYEWSFSKVPSTTMTPLTLNTNPTVPTADNHYNSYLIFVRGDRYAQLAPYTTPNNTVLRATGALLTGDRTFTLSGTPGFRFIGNPYASAIDIRKIYIDPALIDINTHELNYTIWDSRGATNGYGKPVSLTDDGTGNFTGTFPTYATEPLSTTGTIESGQAFGIYYYGGAPATITIHEADKIAGSGKSVFMRPAGELTAEPGKFRINLYAIEADNSAVLADGALLIYADRYQNSVNLLEDTKKLNNFGENLSIYSGGQYLSIEKRKPIVITDTIFLVPYSLKQQAYSFEFLPENMDNPALVGYLEDTYKHTRTQVSLNSPTVIKIVIDGNPASKALDRFRIVFALPEGGPLPVTYSSIKAWQQNRDIAVEWKVENELNIREYEVETSMNGRDFTKATSTAAKGNNNPGSLAYNWLDPNPITGTHYYRVRSIGIDGKVAYSSVVKVTIGRSTPGIVIYPNPVKGGVVGLQLTDLVKGTYHLRLIGNNGQLVQAGEISHEGGSTTQIFRFNKNVMSKAIYQLEVIHPDNSKTLLKLINE